MSLFTDMRDLFAACLDQSLSSEYPEVESIFSHQRAEAQALKGTYVTVNVLSMNKVGNAEESGLINNTERMYIIPYESLVRFTFQGVDAPDASFVAHKRLGTSWLNREVSQAGNVTIINKTDIRQNNFLNGKDWIQNYVFDVTFSFLTSYTETVGVVNEIHVQDLNPPNDEFIITPP